MQKIRSILLAILVVLVLAATGCGGDGDDGDSIIDAVTKLVDSFTGDKDNESSGGNQQPSGGNAPYCCTIYGYCVLAAPLPNDYPCVCSDGFTVYQGLAC